MKIIELIDVQKIYKTQYYEVHALRGISFDVEKGDFLIIMGPSGSGKSTLLHLIGCLDKPSAGKVLINGVETSKLSDFELTNLRRDNIGFIFQQYNLVSTLTALENVELPMLFKGTPKNLRQKRAKELLELVGLEKEIDRRPNELSGGQQQRVAIARALANSPSVLLCDEPTGNLDSKTGEQIMKIIRDLNEEKGVTVVLVTHDVNLKKFGDTVIHLRDGKIQEVEHVH
ncbi:MAG: ABC transporter ATP-binding protein [Archaeoglobales archaeon]|nr:ABC transporter ATP-binding protein [Archaeoglobales archaeon]